MRSGLSPRPPLVFACCIQGLSRHAETQSPAQPIESPTLSNTFHPTISPLSTSTSLLSSWSDSYSL